MKGKGICLSGVLLALLSLILTAGCGSSGSGGSEAGQTDTMPVMLIATDSNGDVWRVNQNDGTATELLDVFINTTSNIGAISSMVYDTDTGKLFAGTENSASCGGCIYIIDPATGKGALFLDPNVSDIPGMAIRSDGTIFASYKDVDTTLYAFDPHTSADLLIGALNAGTTGIGLTFNSSDTLFLGEGAGLSTVNQDNATLTSVESLIFNNITGFMNINPDFWPNSGNHIISMATRLDDGQGFAVVNDTHTYPGEYYHYLVTIDMASAEIELLGEVNADLDGLALIPINTIPTSVQPIAPTNVAAASAPLSVGVTWDKVFGATSYNVYWSTSPGVSTSNYEGVATGITNSFFYSSGTPGTTYYIVVTAVRTGVEGPPSDEMNAIAGDSKGYQVIDFAPESEPLANTVTIGDDAKSAALPIGFSFDFFGISYTEFVIFSNGFISFDVDPSISPNESWRPLSLPSNDEFNNIIAFAWGDHSPDVAGAISYETIGVAPDRRLVLNFRNVTYYGGSSQPNLTSQVILYEGSNMVEIHTTNQDSCQDAGLSNADCLYFTQGAENADGSEAIFVPGRVITDYRLTNDAVRFYTNNL